MVVAAAGRRSAAGAESRLAVFTEEEIIDSSLVVISRPVTLTQPIIKSVTSTPSSPNWGSDKLSSSRTTPRAHRPSTGHWPTPITILLRGHVEGRAAFTVEAIELGSFREHG
jgi:hypothetical protein